METQTTLPVGVVLAQSAGGPSTETTLLLDVSKLPTMAELEKQYLTLVMARSGGSKAAAAKTLGFSVKTIYNKLAEYEANESKAVRNSSQGS